MPKKKQLEKDLKKLAKAYDREFTLIRQGGNHEVWRCDQFTTAIPRHREIAEGTARGIKKSLQKYLDQLGD